MANWRAREGPTLWIDTLGLRNPKLGDLRRLGGEGAGQSTKSLLPAVAVTGPGTIPLHGSRAIYALNARLLARRLRRLDVTPGRTLAWIYLPHPSILRMLDERSWACVVYDVCDELSDFENVSPQILKAEHDLLRRADLVFASSAALVEKAQMYGSRVHYVPNGVESRRFADAPPWSGEVRTVSYVGSVFEWFDEELVAGVATRRDDLRFRIVGPIRRPLDRLRRLPNVELVGPVPAEQVPQELYRCDLCIVPFRSGPLIRATDPLKVYESLAAGRPVLTTDLPQVRRFAPAVRVETDVPGWLTAIRELERGEWGIDMAGTRRQVCSAEDWDRRFEVMGQALEECLTRG